MKAISNPLAAILAATLLAACATATAPEPVGPQRYSGVLRMWFEGQSFHADGEERPWAYGIRPEAMRELGAAFPPNFAPTSFVTEIVAEVEGDLRPIIRDAASPVSPGGNYDHYLLITRVLEARLLRPACEPIPVMVYFDVNDVAISETSATIIDQAVHHAQRQACNVSRVSVVGHADTVGAAQANQALSERRASAVRDALVARGIAADLVIAEGAGETRPPRPTLDNIADPINRSVTITIEAPTGETR